MNQGVGTWGTYLTSINSMNNVLWITYLNMIIFWNSWFYDFFSSNYLYLHLGFILAGNRKIAWFKIIVTYDHIQFYVYIFTIFMHLKVKLPNRIHVLAELDGMLWEQLVWPPFHAANWPSTIWRENLCTLSLFHWRLESVQCLNFGLAIQIRVQLWPQKKD